VFYLPLATNPDRFRPLDHISKENNICFVGDSDYKTIRYISANIENIIENTSESFFQAVELAIKKQAGSVGVSTYGILRDALRLYLFKAPQIQRQNLSYSCPINKVFITSRWTLSALFRS
jgi:hypothetical protein